MSHKKSNEIRAIWKSIKGKYVGDTRGENDSDVKREVPIYKDGPKDAPEHVRTTCAQVVTLDVHKDSAYELVTTINADVPRELLEFLEVQQLRMSRLVLLRMFHKVVLKM